MNENAYSQFVYWTKVILPLAALALLSTLFLLSESPNNSNTIPYAEIKKIAREQRLSNPSFAGVSKDGMDFNIRASVARPDPDKDDTMTVEKVQINLNPTSGHKIEISGGFAEINLNTNTVILDKLARVVTNNGYKMETTGLIATLNEGRIESTAPVEVRSPFGQLTAGRMTLQNTDTNTQIVFNQGIRLLYLPK